MHLIDADEAVKIIKRYDDRGITLDEVTRVTDGIAKEIEAMPTVDAEPVRHGKWMEIVTHNGCTPDYDCVCSLCGNSGAPIDDYCRGCGAKMDGE